MFHYCSFFAIEYQYDKQESLGEGDVVIGQMFWCVELYG